MKEKIFNIFYAQLSNTYRNYCVWKFLQDKKYNLTFHLNSFFWGAILDSGLIAFSIELSKLVENCSKNRNLSIFSLSKDSMQDMEIILKKIKKARNKNWAHFDINTIINQQDFYDKLGLKWGEIEKVFDKMIETLEEVKNDFHEKNDTDFIERFRNIEQKCKEDVERLISKIRQVKHL